MIMPVPRWNCQSCTWSFDRKADLTRHEKTHTGEKPYACDLCPKSFAQRSGLNTHRNTHTKERPHICGIGTCQKAFGDPSSCARHRKETHSGLGYKCVVANCGSRIKRRAAFKDHLRKKHELDPESIDLDAAREGKHSAMPSTSSDADESRSVSPSSLSDNSEYYPLTDQSLGSDSMDDPGWLGDAPLSCRQVDLYPTSHSLLLESMFDQAMNTDPPPLPHDVYTYLPGDIEGQFYYDSVFPQTIDYSLLTDSPLNLPIFEPFLEANSDGSLSSWSSPSSTYSALYTNDFNDGVMSLSLASNTSQEPLLLPSHGAM